MDTSSLWHCCPRDLVEVTLLSEVTAFPFDQHLGETPVVNQGQGGCWGQQPHGLNHCTLHGYLRQKLMGDTGPPWCAFNSSLLIYKPMKPRRMSKGNQVETATKKKALPCLCQWCGLLKRRRPVTEEKAKHLWCAFSTQLWEWQGWKPLNYKSRKHFALFCLLSFREASPKLEILHFVDIYTS